MATNLETRSSYASEFYTSDGARKKDREPVSNLVVMKFGGTSMGSYQAIEQVAGIVDKYHKDGIPIVVVVSAMSNVTNKLQNIFDFTQSENPLAVVNEIGELRERHLDVCRSLNMPSSICRLDLEDELSELFAEIYREVSINGVFGTEKAAKILSYGERLSARLLGKRLGLQAEIVDSSRIVYTDNDFLNATPDLSRTQTKVHEVIDPLLQKGFIPVVTGFIGSTYDGKITLLGRNSSDYSASLIGGALGVREVWFWKDVDGIYDKNGNIIPVLSYEGVTYIEGGTKVVHQRALEALATFGINGRVKNTFNPKVPGTLITDPSQLSQEGL